MNSSIGSSEKVEVESAQPQIPDLSFNSDRLKFCPESFLVTEPLEISNPSDQELVFKIKTNHKNLVSMYINNGFIGPFSSKSIPVKIVENFDSSKTTIKLEINWSIATKEMKSKNDSKMTDVPKGLLRKKVFPIQPISSQHQVQKSPEKTQIEHGSPQKQGHRQTNCVSKSTVTQADDAGTNYSGHPFNSGTVRLDVVSEEQESDCNPVENQQKEGEELNRQLSELENQILTYRRNIDELRYKQKIAREKKQLEESEMGLSQYLLTKGQESLTVTQQSSQSQLIVLSSVLGGFLIGGLIKGVFWGY